MASMRPLPNGRYRVQWYDGTGLRHRKTLKTKKAAQELFEAVSAQQLFDSAGLSPTLGAKAKNIRQMKFRELATRYRDEYLLVETRAQSNAAYIDMLIAKWGEYRIGQLRVGQFREWIRFLLTNPVHTARCAEGEKRQLKPATVNKLVRYMVRVFNWGVESEIIAESPFKCKVRDASLNKAFRRQGSHKPVVLTVEEFEDLVREWPDYVKAPAQAAFYSGVRRSELCTWRWSETDQEKGCVTFAAVETKEADDKTVYYDRELAPLLSRLEVDYIAAGYTDDRVFRAETGEPLSVHSFSNSVSYWARKTAKDTGTEKYARVTPHTFRRSYRTRKGTEGYDAKAVAANMGHHTPAMSERYNVVDEARQRGVAGFGTALTPELKKAIAELVEAARGGSLPLADLQTELRMEWRRQASEAPHEG